jgi:hypothetical protein
MNDIRRGRVTCYMGPAGAVRPDQVFGRDSPNSRPLAIFQSLIVLSGVDSRRQRRATRKDEPPEKRKALA